MLILYPQRFSDVNFAIKKIMSNFCENKRSNDAFITAQINDYLESVSSQYSSLVTLINIGKSHEQRDTYAVKISTGGLTKPVVFIDAGIHAREWIAPTTALYFVNELVKPKNRYLLDKVDVVVIPSINPDGYEYTHTAVRFLFTCLFLSTPD